MRLLSGIHLLLPLVSLSLTLLAQKPKIKADKKYGYSVIIPEWLSIKSNANPFGGTLPAVDSIENAILIMGYSKSEFKSFEEFKTIYISGNKFGQPTLYSSEHIFYGRNEYDYKIIQNGVRSRLFLFWRNHIYHANFVLLETPKSYLWIQFMATPTTYEINLPKFDVFLEGLKIEN